VSVPAQRTLYVFQVHLLAFRADKKVPFADFAGVDVQSLEVFDFHLWLTVVLCD
jgi:hypothetical protein